MEEKEIKDYTEMSRAELAEKLIELLPDDVKVKSMYLNERRLSIKLSDITINFNEGDDRVGFILNSTLQPYAVSNIDLVIENLELLTKIPNNLDELTDYIGIICKDSKFFEDASLIRDIDKGTITFIDRSSDELTISEDSFKFTKRNVAKLLRSISLRGVKRFVSTRQSEYITNSTKLCKLIDLGYTDNTLFYRDNGSLAIEIIIFSRSVTVKFYGKSYDERYVNGSSLKNLGELDLDLFKDTTNINDVSLGLIKLMNIGNVTNYPEFKIDDVTYKSKDIPNALTKIKEY